MAFGTYFNTDIGFGGANLDFVATCTSDVGVGIFRMNSIFHDTLNPLKINFSLYFPSRSGISSNFAGPPVGSPVRR
jgi:hypothetical protein